MFNFVKEDFNDPCIETDIDEELSAYTAAFVAALRTTTENQDISTDFIKGYLNGMKYAISEPESIIIRGYIEGTEEGLRYRENVSLPLKETSVFDETLNIFACEEPEEESLDSEDSDVNEEEKDIEE